MSVRIGINGFGRIGRLVARALYEYDIRGVELVAINSPGSAATSAHLLRYDSVHGNFAAQVVESDGFIDFSCGRVRMTHERDPAKIDWKSVGVDVVMECTGIFRSKEAVQPHFEAGAKQVLISAPADNVDKTIVFGVNERELSSKDVVVSCASCTTNCLAPIVRVVLDAIGIQRGFMNTVHSYTQDQRILDNSHKDLYRARSAGLNMIPTSTGAARAVGLVIPEVSGKLAGSAVRVPTANVSMCELIIQPDSKATEEVINAAMHKAANNEMSGIIRYIDEKLVSSDMNHDPHSAIFAAPLTRVMDGDLVKLVAWYDNEWGFANRMIDVAKRMSKTIQN